MGDRHTTVEKYSLAEHAQLRHSLHHRVLLEHQRQGRIFLPENFSSEPSAAAASEWALDDYYFLQPVPARQRRSLLREAGVVRIDPVEREECRTLRLSRSRCGCSCREACRPPSCPCCRSGIGCQVDQMAFPCSCSRVGCANPHGRVEFNAARVRAHFIRTLLQLGLERSGSAECDAGLPPPEKRCCLDSDQLPSSVSLPSSSAFSPPSSSSLLPVSSACLSSASLPTNGFETQRVYFDTVERLPGPETVVVAYDEEYDDEDDEDSSETSSDGDNASFDQISDDVDGEIAAVPNDPRQRTLDDYVIRFRRQHSYTDLGPCNSSTADVATEFQFTSSPTPVSLSSSSAPSNSSIANVTTGFQFTPLPVSQPQPSAQSDSNTAVVTTEFQFTPIPWPSPSTCSTANVTAGFQFIPLPVPQLSPSSYSTSDVTAGFQFSPIPVPQLSPHKPSNNSTSNVTAGFQINPLPIPQPSPSTWNTAGVTTGFQFAPLPVPLSSTNAPLSSMLTSITALNSSLNAHLSCVVTCPGMTLPCPQTQSSSVDMTPADCVPCSLPSVYNIPDDIRHDFTFPSENTHAASDNCCVSIATMHECPHLCHNTDSTTYDCSVSYKENSIRHQETADNCSTQHSNEESDSATTCSTQQDAIHIQSPSDDTKHGCYSSLEDTTTCIWSTASGNYTPGNTAQGYSEPDVMDSRCTEHDSSTLGLDTDDHDYTGIDGTDGTTAAPQDTAYGCCRPDDTVHADCCKTDDDGDDDDDDAEGYSTADSITRGTDDATCGCSVPDTEGTHVVSLVPGSYTHYGTSVDGASPQCSTNSSSETEANASDASGVPGQCCVGVTSPSCTATDTDDIVHTSSTSENATSDGIVPDITAGGCSVPCDLGHGCTTSEKCTK